MESNFKASDRFEKKEKLGEGTYGVVYKAMDMKTKKFFAIKKIKLDREDEGIPSTTLREITLLKSLDHPNVVKLHEVEYSHESKKLFLIFEFLDSDLRKALDKSLHVNHKTMIKSFMYQLLKGMDYCHSKRILHRDLKPQNILVSKEGVLKIADFGLSRTYCQPTKPFTRDIVTLWYRAPEILLGSEKYLIQIDMWSIGCIFAEMVNQKPLLMGDSQIDQIYKIFSLFGTPNETTWPGVSDLPHYKVTFPCFKPCSLEKIAPNLDADGLDLLSKLLCLNPANRISAKKALEHPYFFDIENN